MQPSTSVFGEPESVPLAESRHRVAVASATGDLAALRGEDVMAAWTGSSFPEHDHGSEFWIRAFRQTHEWFQFSKGTEPLELFRGTVPAHTRGMAWTTDRLQAYDFAWAWLHGPGAPSGARQQSEAYVYRTLLDRDAILCEVDANFNLSGRHHEKEVIVDPRRLGEIECVETVLRGADRASRRGNQYS